MATTKQPTNTTYGPQKPVDYTAAYNDVYNGIAGEVNKYADELVGFAQGDYDYAAKWIESNYKLALGEDDRERANFLKQVASTLEQKVGRIAYDYQTGTYRLGEDKATDTQRTLQGRDQALARLAEDEQVYKADAAKQNARDDQTLAESLNSRGILAGDPKTATGLAGHDIREQHRDQADTMAAFERELGRNREDVNQAADYNLADINRTYTRGTEDLTTQARRGAIDTQQSHDQQLESAKRALEQAKLQAEQQRRAGLNQAKSYADYTTRGALGLG